MVDTGEADGLEDLYRAQIAPIVGEEAKKRIEMYSDPEEDQRLLSFPIGCEHPTGSERQRNCQSLSALVAESWTW